MTEKEDSIDNDPRTIHSNNMQHDYQQAMYRHHNHHNNYDVSKQHMPYDRLPIRAGDIFLEPGYCLEPIVTRLNYPTTITFDDNGNIYVGEAGYSYGPGMADGRGRILKVEHDGRLKEIARGFRGPMTAATWHDGFFYVAEGAFPGRILRVSMDGEKEVIVEGLRSGGDHFTSDIVFGPDGAMYFGVGTFTNSAIVGFDSFLFGWLPDIPNGHDVPAFDTVVRGINFEFPDPFALVNGEMKIVSTGAYMPLGMSTTPYETIPGSLYCNAVIYRCNSDGSNLQVYASGLRNPYALDFSPEGRFYAIDQGYDVRGSRPVNNAVEPMWEIVPGGWYGWPDYVAGEPITDPKFKPAGKPQPDFLLAEHPPLAGKPLFTFPFHSACTDFDFSMNPEFGFVGEAFVTQVGAETPGTGPPVDHPGYSIVRANLQTGETYDFFRSNNPMPGGTGPARPVEIRFDPSGRNLYFLDFGVLTGNVSGAIPWANSGALWKICRS